MPGFPPPQRRRRRRFIALAVPAFLWLFLAPAPAQEAPPLPPELRRSTSLSRQFTIYAHDSVRRAAFSRFAEETRAALQRVLGLREDWRLPIVVHLVRPAPGAPGETPASRLLLAQTGAGLKVQLDLRLHGPGAADAVRPRDEVIRALLLELAYRDRPDLPAGRAFQPPPAWLVEGCAAAVDSALAGGNRDELAGVAAEIRSALKVATQTAALPLEKYLSRDPAGLDSPSRALYRAYAFGLVRLLTAEMPGGQEGLVAFIRALPAAKGSAQSGLEALRWHLPGAGDKSEDLQRRWSETVARLAAAETAIEIYGVEETERRLKAILAVRMPPDRAAGRGAPRGKGRSGTLPATGGDGERGIPLEDFEKFLQPGKSHAGENTRRLRELRANLLRLFARAHPGYREIVGAYEALVAQLGSGRFDGAREQLQRLAAARAETRTRQEAIADYLNWFEATQLHTPSGTFEPYFQAGRDLDRLAPRARRSDPISTYLDGIERGVR